MPYILSTAPAPGWEISLELKEAVVDTRTLTKEQMNPPPPTIHTHINTFLKGFCFHYYECLPEYTYVHHLCAWFPTRPERVLDPLEVDDDCELPCGW